MARPATSRGAAPRLYAFVATATCPGGDMDDSASWDVSCRSRWPCWAYASWHCRSWSFTRCWPGADHAAWLAGQWPSDRGGLNNANLTSRPSWPARSCITAAAIGLYRPEICIERRRLLMNTIVAGLLAFPAVLVVSRSFNIGLSRYAMLWLSKSPARVARLHGREPPDLQPRHARALVRPAHSGARFGSELVCAPPAAGPATGRGRLFEPVFAERQDAGPGVGGRGADRLMALRRQRIWGIVVAGNATARSIRHYRRGFCWTASCAACRCSSEAGFCEQHLGRIDLDSADVPIGCCSPTASPTRGCQMRSSAASTSRSAWSCCC